MFLDYITSLSRQVKQGIPFNVNKRTAIIKAIGYDLEADKNVPIESFYRIS